MGGSRYRIHVLSTVAATTACFEPNDVETPEWIPIQQLPAEIGERDSPPLADTLRVVTYNVEFGVDAEIVGRYFLANPDLARADVIALQENIRQRGADVSDAGPLAEVLGMNYVFVPFTNRKRGEEGISMLSRYPLRDVQLMILSDFIEGEYLDTPATRVALAATIDTTRGPIRIINTHLSVQLNMPERVLQLRPAVIDPVMPTVVLGDFNTNEYIWAYDRIPLLPLDASADTSQAPELDEYMRLIGYAAPTARFGSTWDGFPEDQRLDSIFTYGLESGSGGVDRGLDFSDHWPLFLDVTLPP